MKNQWWNFTISVFFNEKKKKKRVHLGIIIYKSALTYKGFLLSASGKYF